MTIGFIEYGVSGSSFWSKKQWTGTDGLRAGDVTITRPGHWSIYYKRRWNKFLRCRETYIHSKRWIPEKTVSKVTRNKTKWNDYTVFQRYVKSIGSNSQGNDVLGYLYSGANGNDGTFLSSYELLQLENKLMTKIRGHSFSYAVAVAQPKLTEEMIVSTIGRLAGAIKAVRKGNFLRAINSLGVKAQKRHSFNTNVVQTSDDVARIWLEMQYGWKPLLMDVHDGAEALAYNLNVSQEKFLSQLKVKKTKLHHVYTSDGYANIDATAKHTRHIYVRWADKILGSATTSVSQNLGLTDPLSLVWEVIPFSFIADWFIPIGTFLENRYQSAGLVAQYMITDFWTVDTRVTGITPGLYSGCQGVNRIMTMTRTPYVNLPLTKPKFHVPNVSSTHFWNSLALLRTAVLGKGGTVRPR